MTDPTPSIVLPRRTLLTSGAAVAAGTALLAACGGGSESADAGTPASTGATSASAAAGATVVALSDVPVGGAVSAKLDGKDVIVAQPTAGAVVAFDAACTHAGCPVAVAGAELDCPCHGSKFNALTGAVLTGPANAPLPAVSVKVDGANVVSA